jgi:hypothetical protein
LEDVLKYHVQRGPNVYEFEDRQEAIDYARELSESGEVTVNWTTNLAQEQIQYKDGEMLSFRSESVRRGR